MKARDMSLIIVCVLFVVLSGLYMLFSNRLPELFYVLSEEEKAQRRARKAHCDTASDADSVQSSLSMNWLWQRNHTDLRDDTPIVSGDSRASSFVLWGKFGASINDNSNGTMIGSKALTDHNKKMSWKKSVQMMFTTNAKNDFSLHELDMNLNDQHSLHRASSGINDTMQVTSSEADDHAGVDSFYIMHARSQHDGADSIFEAQELTELDGKRVDPVYGVEMIDVEDDVDQDTALPSSDRGMPALRSPGTLLQTLYQGWFGSSNAVADASMSADKKRSAMILQQLGERGQQPNLQPLHPQTQSDSKQIGSFFGIQDFLSSDSSQLGNTARKSPILDHVYGVQLEENADDCDSLPTSLHGSPTVSSLTRKSLIRAPRMDASTTVVSEESLLLQPELSTAAEKVPSRAGSGLVRSALSWFQAAPKAPMALQPLVPTSSIDEDNVFNPAKSTNSLLNRSFRDAVDSSTAESQKRFGGEMAGSSFYSLQGDLDSLDDTSHNGLAPAESSRLES
jgi:hypothetical protein